MTLNPQLEAKVRALQDSVQHVLEALRPLKPQTVDEATVTKALEAVHTTYRDVASVDGVGTVHSDFSDFFMTLGTAVVDAQKKLDVASIDYLSDPARSAAQLLEALRPDLKQPGREAEHAAALRTLADGLFRAPRSFFRIPKVSAEMKFSLEKTQGKDISLVFYSTKDEAREQHQQSVNFEIVSVPPPPDYQALQPPAQPPQARIPIASPLVVDPDARARALNRFDDGQLNGSKTAPALRKDEIITREERVLISGTETETLSFVLARRRPDSLLVWQLDAKTSAMVLAYDMPASAAAGLAPLHGILVDLCDAMADFLAPPGL